MYFMRCLNIVGTDLHGGDPELGRRLCRNWWASAGSQPYSTRGLSTRRQTRLHERGLNSPLRLLSPPDRAHVQFAPRCAPRCERGSSLAPCRLGGDRANRFRPPRADDHSVTSNRSSEAPSIGEKLEMPARQAPFWALSC